MNGRTFSDPEIKRPPPRRPARRNEATPGRRRDGHGAPRPRLYKRSEDRPAELDLELRWLDVRRISKTIPAYRACLAAGLEEEDLDQEVLTRIVARQRHDSRSKYNPERSCVSKYLYVAASGILLNLLDQAVGTERSRKEVVGAIDPSGTPCDAALVAGAWDAGQSCEEEWL